MITSVGTMFNSKFKPESPYVAKHMGGIIDSNCSQVFSLEDVVMENVKKCTRCKKEKPAIKDYFYWRKKRNNFAARCKECMQKIGRKYLADNRSKVKILQHKRREEQELLAGEPPLCKCGCREKVKWGKWDNRWNAYTIGHGRRGPDFLKQQALLPDEPLLCACGCGERTKNSIETKSINEYYRSKITVRTINSINKR